MTKKKSQRKTKLNRTRLESRIIKKCGSLSNFVSDDDIPFHKNTRIAIVADAEIREKEGRTKLAPFLGVAWEFLKETRYAKHEFDDSVVNSLREIAERELILGRNLPVDGNPDQEFNSEQWLLDLAKNTRRIRQQPELYEIVVETRTLLIRDGLLENGIEDQDLCRFHSYTREEITEIALDRSEYETVLMKRSRDRLDQFSLEGLKNLAETSVSLLVEGEHRVRRGLSFQTYDYEVHKLLVGVGRRPEVAIKFVSFVKHNDRPYLTFRRLAKRIHGAKSNGYGNTMETFNRLQLSDHEKLLREMFCFNGRKPRITVLANIIREHALRSVTLWEESQIMIHLLRKRLG